MNKLLALPLILSSLVSPLTQAHTWVNEKEDFLYFLETTKDAEFSEKEALFAKLFEEDNAEFYAEGIFDRGLDDEWEEKRLKSLQHLFTEYQKFTSEDFANAYDNMATAADIGLKEFDSHLSDHNLNLQVNLVPGVLWGGSVEHMQSGNMHLALGVDLSLLYSQYLEGMDLSLLVIHEVSHAYHLEKQGWNATPDEFKENYTMASRMWQEGMANWLSSTIRPNHDLGHLNSGTQLDRCALAELAPKFPEIANLKIHGDNTKVMTDWFSPNSEMKLNNGETVEPMVGYFLGALAIKELAASGMTRDELLSIDYRDVTEPLTRGLEIVAKKYRCN